MCARGCGDDDAVDVGAAQQSLQILSARNTELGGTGPPECQVVIPDRDELRAGMLLSLPRVVLRMNMPEPQDRDLERLRHFSSSHEVASTSSGRPRPTVQPR